MYGIITSHTDNVRMTTMSPVTSSIVPHTRWDQFASSNLIQGPNYIFVLSNSALGSIALSNLVLGPILFLKKLGPTQTILILDLWIEINVTIRLDHNYTSSDIYNSRHMLL